MTGESYAGKYVPATSFYIHTMNQDSTNTKINLKGLAIGDGAMDPQSQFQGFGDLLWHLGMVDELERLRFKQYEADIQYNLENGDRIGAFRSFNL